MPTSERDTVTVLSAAEGPDRFDGISLRVDHRFERMTPKQFADQLGDAMTTWKSQGVRGVW